jgi:hypothetical protein
MSIKDVIPGGIVSLVEDNLPNRTPLSDLRSILVRDAAKVDPSFDITGARTQTATRPELLAAVPEFSGFEFDPTQRSYVEDLYALYAGGVPTRDVAMGDSAQIPGAINTLVNVGGGGGMDQVTGGLDTTPEQTFADQPVTSITPGTTVDNVTGDITNPDGSFGGNIVDEVALTGAAPSGITGDPIVMEDLTTIDGEPIGTIGTISGPPVISPVLTNIGPVEGTVDPTKAFADQTPLTDVELAEQGFLTPISQVTPPGFEPTVTINETPETFIDKTKNFLGLDNVDLPDFAIKAAINKTIGQPITLAFDLAKNIFDRQTTQDQGVTPDAGFADVVDDQGITADDAFDTTNEAATNVASVNEADVEAGLATESIADIDPADDFEVSGDVANVGTAMDLIGPAPTPQDIPDRGRGDTPGSGQISDAQAAANRDAARGQTGGGNDGGGSPKIVCTMMNESYGFGSFRNKIWLRHSKDLAPEYQIGYHKIFLPLVKLSKTNKILKKILEHIAVHRTIDIRQESRGKAHLLGRIYRKILEPICYLVGKYAKR